MSICRAGFREKLDEAGREVRRGENLDGAKPHLDEAENRRAERAEKFSRPI